ncbi:Tim10/DDP family zinc finger [Pseudocohnilembus persalinus]|uniref:Mitochondrial import inner membrane translocase subunit n=1 Tax=Pseudocohnilembus persalinus TaxID=266149 RepID=A0A0V0QVI1_PSEPJ|nr:Tim10/DDP family zinc finger [Pseudocohnilembus persalinus]|eukprot:KRX06222.1 Tim10/DDP family zinc finger [Pseudocohnilembus persalinus]
MSSHDHYDQANQYLNGVVNQQAKREQQKQGTIQMFKNNLQQIYNVCSKKCLNNFKKADLQDNDRQCLSRCFDRKQESFNLAMGDVGKYQEIHSSKQKESSKSLF